MTLSTGYFKSAIVFKPCSPKMYQLDLFGTEGFPFGCIRKLDWNVLAIFCLVEKVSLTYLQTLYWKATKMELSNVMPYNNLIYLKTYHNKYL